MLINPRQRRSHANMTSGTQSMIQARPPLRVFLWVCAYIYTYTYVYVFLCFVFRARTVPPLMVMAVFFFFFFTMHIANGPSAQRLLILCVVCLYAYITYYLHKRYIYSFCVCMCVFSRVYVTHLIALHHMVAWRGIFTSGPPVGCFTMAPLGIFGRTCTCSHMQFNAAVATCAV